MSEIIRFRCPGCGSELETPESTVSNRCRYCALVSLLGRPGRIVKRYYEPRINAHEARFLADRYLKKEGRQLFSQIDRQLLCYAPFYRFRGLSLTCFSSVRPNSSPFDVGSDPRLPTYELRARNLDLTVPGHSGHPFGVTSLGIRPQAVPAYAYRDNEIPGEAVVWPVDLLPAESQKRAVQMNAANSAMVNSTKQLEFSELVGEHQSVIFFPFWVLCGRDGMREIKLVVDGLSRRVVRDSTESFSEPAHSTSVVGITDLQPEPHKCPNCGADFEPSEHSLVYDCRNCDRTYMLEAAGYRQLSQPLVGDGHGDLYPFWRCPLAYDGQPAYDTVGAFARLLTADVPLLDRRKRHLPFYLYVPAFMGADAEWQVQIAVRMTRTQPLVDPGRRRPVGVVAASLPEPESREFAAFAWNWLRMSYLNLRSQPFEFDRASTGPSELVWLPLTDARLARSAARAREAAQTRPVVRT